METHITKVLTLAIATIFSLLTSVAAFASPMQESDARQHDLSEIRKLIECAERYHNFPPAYHGSRQLEWSHMDALIASHRFDDAFEKIKNSSTVASDRIENYCTEMFFAGMPENVTQQITEIESLHASEFERSPVDFAERFKKIKFTATVLTQVKTESEDAIDLVIDCMENHRGWKGRMSPNRFWIRAVHAAGGGKALDQFVDRVVESIVDEKKRSAKRAELLIYAQPESAIQAYYRQINRARIEAEYPTLQKTAKMPLEDWLFSALKILRRRHISKTHRGELASEVVGLLSDEGLTDPTHEQIRWGVLLCIAEDGNWPLVFRLIEQNPPDKHWIAEYADLCYLAGTDDMNRLDRLVEFLPDAVEIRPYSERLVDFLLLAGYLNKAKKNVWSLGEGPSERYRKKIQFYEIFHGPALKDISKITAAYTLYKDEGEYDLNLLLRDLGTDHLAEVAIRQSPETALQLARTIPVDNYYNNKNPLGLCVSSLIRRNKVELAFEMIDLASAAEIENARLELSTKNNQLIDDNNWKRLESLVPNDQTVLAQLIRIAAEAGDMPKALALVKRSLLYHRNIYGSVQTLVNAGWAEELMELAGEVEKEKDGDPYFKQFQIRQAIQVGACMKFGSAEEAIAFSRKRVKRGKKGAQFLLDLALKWAKE